VNKISKVMLSLGQLVADLSSWRPRFNPRPVRVRLVMDRVTLGEVWLWVLTFSLVCIILPNLHSQ